MEWHGVYKQIHGYFIYKNSQTSVVNHPYGINRNSFFFFQTDLLSFTDRKSSVNLGKSHDSTVLLGIEARKYYP